MKSALKWIFATLTVLAAAWILMTTIFGLRVELAGSGITPIFYFADSDARFNEIEQRSGNASIDASLDQLVWPEFRGPSGDGRVADEIRTEWPAEGLPQLWKQSIGGGYSTFVVAGETAFTIEQRREQEVVVAYDVGSGTEAWAHAWDAAFREAMGGDGPRAGLAMSQTQDGGGIVYALGAAGELRALRAQDGELIWRRDILKDAVAENLQWGMSSAPLFVPALEEGERDLLITLPGGRDGASVIAYDAASGEIAWTALSDQATYAAPRLVELAGKRQILAVTAKRAVGLDSDGELLWEVPWEAPYETTGAQPEILDEHRILLSSAGGSVVYRVDQGADGWTTEELWSANSLKANFSSMVVEGGFVYGLDKGILVCVDLADGERRWKGGRYGHGQMLGVDGFLVVLTEKGEVALVRATPEQHDEVAIFPAIEGKTWNHPVIVNGTLLVRNHREAAAFEIGPQPSAL